MNNLMPTFLTERINNRKEPSMPDSPRSLLPATTQMLDGIARQAEENQTLKVDNEALRARLAEREMQLDLTRRALIDAEYKRDFYQRIATSLRTSLGVINGIIIAEVRKADAQGQLAEGRSETASNLDDQHVEDLARKIEGEQG